jgi:hypothetical protein
MGVGEGLRGEAQSKRRSHLHPSPGNTAPPLPSPTAPETAGSITPFGLPGCHVSVYRMNRSGPSFVAAGHAQRRDRQPCSASAEAGSQPRRSISPPVEAGGFPRWRLTCERMRSISERRYSSGHHQTWNSPNRTKELRVKVLKGKRLRSAKSRRLACGSKGRRR